MSVVMMAIRKQEKQAKPPKNVPSQPTLSLGFSGQSHRTAETVAFDTNMLLNIKRFNVDVFRQAQELLGKVEFVVPQEVVRELKMLSKRGKNIAKEAKIAEIAMEKNGVKVVDFGQKNADLALLKMAPMAIIGTNDKELKSSVRELNGRVLILRQRKFLEL